MVHNDQKKWLRRIVLLPLLLLLTFSNAFAILVAMPGYGIGQKIISKPCVWTADSAPTNTISKSCFWMITQDAGSSCSNRGPNYFMFLATQMKIPAQYGVMNVDWVQTTGPGVRVCTKDLEKLMPVITNVNGKTELVVRYSFGGSGVTWRADVSSAMKECVIEQTDDAYFTCTLKD